MCFWNEGIGWWMLVGGVLTLLCWLAIIGLVIWAIVKLTGYSTRHDDALEILRRRYALGEIDKKEFDDKKKDLFLS